VHFSCLYFCIAWQMLLTQCDRRNLFITPVIGLSHSTWPQRMWHVSSYYYGLLFYVEVSCGCWYRYAVVFQVFSTTTESKYHKCKGSYHNIQAILSYNLSHLCLWLFSFSHIVVAVTCKNVLYKSTVEFNNVWLIKMLHVEFVILIVEYLLYDQLSYFISNRI